ncbi:tetratricopeptide repeat protein [Kitasatospora brasiliensis]|uniref:tetratricopeptide repeat protein n=1 Tax=Kitasatospora brasiliensis TaxID=3058040 RepID=UPI002931F605|nr:tetratricopeptide repeat protein [Kitasatospora sp. K002]
MPVQAGLALTLNNLSNRWAGAGRDEEALAAIEEAVDLHGAAIDASLDDVASCLSNLAVRLGSLHRWNVAETALAESTKIRLKLNLTNPGVNEADLAQSRAIAAWLEDRRAARGTY